MHTIKSGFIIFLLALIGSATFAGQVEVVDVSVNSQGKNQYRFDVTLKHNDVGWEHYANKWEILDTKGNILATRILHHPHVNEQPFTRSLDVTLPDTVKTVVLRGHDKVHQYGEKVMRVSVP